MFDHVLLKLHLGSHYNLPPEDSLQWNWCKKKKKKKNPIEP